MDAQRRNRTATTFAAAGLLALLVSGCTAAPDPPSESVAESPSATPTRTPTPTPTPLVFPPITDDEIARAEFRSVGPDGVPQNSSISSNIVEVDKISLLGECVGTRAHFELYTAAVDSERRKINSGVMMCGTPWRTDVAGFNFTGPMQLSFTDTNGVSEGVIVVIPSAG